MPRSSLQTGSTAAVAALLLGGLVGAAVAAGGCAQVRDVALELHAASEAQAWLADADPVREVLASGKLDCAAAYASPLAALCVQLYTLADGTVSMEATCHDAPNLASDADLQSFLRGLGAIADGISTDPDTRVFVRLLGFSSAARAADSLVLCGITPSLPGHVDGSASPSTLPVYVLCHEPAAPASEAGTVFGDYCASSDFVAIFP